MICIWSSRCHCHPLISCFWCWLTQVVLETHNTQLFYGSVEFVRENPGELVPEETFTHYTHRGHQSSLSAFSIYNELWHPPYSIHVLYSLFPQSLSKFSLVYLLACYPPLYTPYISSPNHCLLFAAHAHTIATCSAVVPRIKRLYHLILVSLSLNSTWNSIF